jgi:CheY-like chemotaxis protein
MGCFDDANVLSKRCEMAKILIVDDLKWVRDYYSLELRRDGHAVSAASDVETALTAFQTDKPDLVVMDLMLGEEVGWELLRKIKRLSPATPVLIMSAFERFRQDPRLHPADGYLLKNIEMLDELKQRIGEHVAPRLGLDG